MLRMDRVRTRARKFARFFYSKFRMYISYVYVVVRGHVLSGKDYI